jgi:hypothetical protein
MAYRFAETADSQGRKNLKFGYFSHPRGHRYLHEGKIRMTIANGLFFGNYIEGRLPAMLVSKDTMTYKGVPHTTFCISTFCREELETFMQAVEVTNIWSLRQQADRLEKEHKEKWGITPIGVVTEPRRGVEYTFDDDDSLPF